MNSAKIKSITFALLASGIMTGCGSGGSKVDSAPVNSHAKLSSDDLNFIFVQSFEPNVQGNNLSITGFNHSLQFGQLLNQITGGNISAVMSLDPWTQIINGYPNMSPIQSIENYAVLNGIGIYALLPTTIGNYYEPIFPSVAYYIEEIIGQTSQIGVPSSGNFVIALPSQQINQTLAQLSQNPNLSFTYTPLESNNYHQYAVLSINNVAQAQSATYNDGIISSNQYPNLQLNTNSACQESSVTFTLQGTVPPNMNRNETVYLIRHVEAHPVYSFDNGNYVCQGQWRAIGAVNKLESVIGGLPNLVYSSDPGDPYSCTNGSSFLPAESCPTYVRPSLTINPFVIKNSMPLNLVAESNFNWNNYQAMAQYFFQESQFSNQTILIAWEHDTVNSMLDYLIGTIYDQPESVALIPTWAGNDYDTIWKIQLNQNGQLTFSNTCEGISSATLPLSCPAF